MMPEAMAQPFEHGLRLDPETCTLINHYPGVAPVVDEPEEPPAPQPEEGGDGPGDLSCATRGCDFSPGAACQCDAACASANDCCDFDGSADDGPSSSC
jgi:hypothetical protein